MQTLRSYMFIVATLLLVAETAYANTGFGCNATHWMLLLVPLLWALYSLKRVFGVRKNNAKGDGEDTEHKAPWIVSLLLALIAGLLMYIFLPGLIRCSQTGSEDPGWYVAYSDPMTGEYLYSNVFADEEACSLYEQEQLQKKGVPVLISCFENEGGIPETIRDTDTFENVYPEGVASNTPITIEDLESIITDTGVRQPEARDTIPPIISILGDNPAVVPVGGSYTDAGATARDESDGDVSGNIQVSGLPVVTFIDSWFSITYTARDASGNAATAVRRVHVIDTGAPPMTDPQIDPVEPSAVVSDEAPEIVLLGSEPAYVYVGATYEDAGVSAVDLEDGDLTRLVISSGLPINTNSPGTYTVQYSVMDTDRNMTRASRTVIVVVPQLDTSMDLAYMQSCRDLESPIPECAVTDLDGDGYTTFADEAIMLANAGRFEMTGDVRIERANTQTVESCFLKIHEGGSLACAKTNHGDQIIQTDYLYDTFGPKLDNAQTDEFGYVFDLGILESQTSGLFDDILYWSIAQYDLNKDDIVDFEEALSNPDYMIHRDCLFEETLSSSCAVADINRDGKVSDWDRYFVSIATGQLLPSTFEIGRLEVALFDRQGYTDAEVLAYCVSEGSTDGNCVFADVNEDGEVNQADMDLFNSETSRYDFNKDNVVDGTLSISL